MGEMGHYSQFLQWWKLEFEKNHLEKYPFLKREPIRHKKLCIKPSWVKKVR